MNGYSKILVALITLVICAGVVMAADFSYQSVTDRPGNFFMNNQATTSGYANFQSSTLANAGGIDEMTMVNVNPVNMALGAPLAETYQNVYLDFFKHGTTVDPAVQETVISKITVGAVSTAKVPTFGLGGSLEVGSGVGEGYDLFTSTVGGIVGTPVSSGGHLTGINSADEAGAPRYVFSQVQSAQDDYVWAQGRDSAGNIDTNGNPSNVMNSFTTAFVGSPTMPENTPYTLFDWMDTRGFEVNQPNEWAIQNTVNYQQILPSDYRTGKYLGIFL